MLLPLQGDLWITGLPKVLPWARWFYPFRTCGAYLREFSSSSFLSPSLFLTLF